MCCVPPKAHVPGPDAAAFTEPDASGEIYGCHSKWTATLPAEADAKHITVADGQCARLLKDRITSRMAARTSQPQPGSAGTEDARIPLRVPAGTTCKAECQQETYNGPLPTATRQSATFTCNGAGVWEGSLLCPGTERGIASDGGSVLGVGLDSGVDLDVKRKVDGWH
jgi:hypothetical protein